MKRKAKKSFASIKNKKNKTQQKEKTLCIVQIAMVKSFRVQVVLMVAGSLCWFSPSCSACRFAGCPSSFPAAKTSSAPSAAPRCPDFPQDCGCRFIKWLWIMESLLYHKRRDSSFNIQLLYRFALSDYRRNSFITVFVPR